MKTSTALAAAWTTDTNMTSGGIMDHGNPSRRHNLENKAFFTLDILLLLRAHPYASPAWQQHPPLSTLVQFSHTLTAAATAASRVLLLSIETSFIKVALQDAGFAQTALHANHYSLLQVLPDSRFQVNAALLWIPI